MNLSEILLCTTEDECYPTVLRESVKKVKMLYYKGHIDIVNQYKNVAVIGSRNASAEGLKLAYRAGQQAAEKGITVVNGLALGCDTEAIKGALSVGGRCVAIMPCGLEQIYPKSNQKLADEILTKGGCLLSEYPVGTSIQKHQYVERDRLQSGISQGVLIIEAEKMSGTMHTAEFARQQYKRLACYAAAMLKLSTGNRYLEEKNMATILQGDADTENFLNGILDEPKYEQLELKL